MTDKDQDDQSPISGLTPATARMLLEYLFGPDGLDAELAEEARYDGPR